MKNSKLVVISEFKPENLKLKDIRFLPPNIIEPRNIKGSKFLQNSVEEVKVNSNVFYSAHDKKSAPTNFHGFGG